MDAAHKQVRQILAALAAAGDVGLVGLDALEERLLAAEAALSDAQLELRLEELRSSRTQINQMVSGRWLRPARRWALGRLAQANQSVAVCKSQVVLISYLNQQLVSAHCVSVHISEECGVTWRKSVVSSSWLHAIHERVS